MVFDNILSQRYCMFTSGTQWVPSFRCRGWHISLAQKWQEMQPRISEEQQKKEESIPQNVALCQGFTLSYFLYCVLCSHCSAFPEWGFSQLLVSTENAFLASGLHRHIPFPAQGPCARDELPRLTQESAAPRQSQPMWASTTLNIVFLRSNFREKTYIVC